MSNRERPSQSDAPDSRGTRGTSRRSNAPYSDRVDRRPLGQLSVGEGTLRLPKSGNRQTAAPASTETDRQSDARNRRERGLMREMICLRWRGGGNRSGGYVQKPMKEVLQCRFLPIRDGGSW